MGSSHPGSTGSKGNKQRMVYINDKIACAMREYLKERKSDSPYFFVSRQSGKLTPSRINQIFNKYSDIITPKTLRHSFAVASLRAGDIKTVQENLGHHTAAFTLDVCGHVTDQMKQASADRMQRFITGLKE